jgi:hypothetical protein
MLSTPGGLSVEALRHHLVGVPTWGQFTAFDAAYDYFNRELFAGALPPMALHFERRPRLSGFYCPAAWYGGEEEEIAEIVMNPEVLRLPAREALSILVHKMCHYWQFGYGTPSRTTIHNREWAEKMLEIGLGPDTAAQPGVRLAGQRIGHTILTGSSFASAFASIPTEVLLPWTSPRVADHCLQMSY